MTKLTTPIPQDKIGENFVWRDWFQRLSNTVYGTLASQDSSNVNITGGTIAPGLVGVAKIIAGTNVSISPSSGTGDVIISSSGGGGGGSLSAPVIETANFTLTTPTNWVINNKSGSTCTATLPAASSYLGYTITLQNYQDQSLVSATSNIIPLGGGNPGTSILDNCSGSWATLVSNGSNWVVVQQSPNSSIRLENNCVISVDGILVAQDGALLTESGLRLVLG